jgi:hypothetical protein
MHWKNIAAEHLANKIQKRRSHDPATAYDGHVVGLKNGDMIRALA